MDLISLHDLPKSEDLHVSFLQNMCEQYDLDHAAYAGINPTLGTMHALVTYSEAWKEHYVAKGFQRIDPTLHTAMRSVAPVDWARLKRDANFHLIFNDAADFGIGDTGLTIPIRGPFGEFGMFSVTKSCDHDTWQHLKRTTIGSLQEIAAHIHDHVMHTDRLNSIVRRPRLSRREVEILQWVAAGKSQQDIGDILAISYRTVEVHLRSARSKLMALSTPQAIGRAVALGIIYPS